MNTVAKCPYCGEYYELLIYVWVNGKKLWICIDCIDAIDKRSFITAANANKAGYLALDSGEKGDT